MADGTANDILEYAQALQTETQTIREEAIRFERIHGMYLLPKLPPSLLVDEAVYMLSPEGIHEAREIKARVMTFETEVQARPTGRTAAGTISDDNQKAADKIEKAGAITLSRLDPNLTLWGRVIDNQLIKPLSIVIFELGAIDTPDPAKRFPWRAYDVEIDGCGWLEAEGLPTVFARQYSQFVSTTERLYSGRADGPKGANSRLEMKGGKPTWEVLTDDWTPRTRPAVSSSGAFERNDMVMLDDGRKISHVCVGGLGSRFSIGPLRFGQTNQREAELVWEGPNPFGRVSAFLIGSNMRAARQIHDSYLPYLVDLLTTMEQENVIDSIRASASRLKAAPRDYIHGDPEVIKAYMQTHNGEMPPSLEWADGKTPISYGEIKSRPMDVDPDLEKLDGKLETRKQKFSNASSSTLRDPDVLQHSTAAAILSAFDADAASLSVLVGPQDTWRRQMLQAWEHSINHIAKTYGPKYAQFSLQAQSDVTVRGGRRYGAGESVEIDPSSFEVGHEWMVFTRERTRGQSQAEYAAAVERMSPMVDGRPGPGVYDDLFTALHVSDVDERRMILAREALMWESIDPQVNIWVKDRLKYEILVESAINVDLLGSSIPPDASAGLPSSTAPGGPAGPEPNTGATTNSPVTEPAAGGSGPDLVAG